MKTNTNIGLFSLVDNLMDPVTGEERSHQQRLMEVIEQGVLAENAGFERFAVGEHHFSSYILPNPDLILSALAVRTERIRLFTTVTLLLCRNTIRLAENIALLDNISNGRTEYSFARGVNYETAEAFGISKDRIYPVIAEKISHLLTAFHTGKFPPSPENKTVNLVPMPIQKPYPPIWIGGGLSEKSCNIAAEHGLPLILPSLFRYPEDYLPLVNTYRSKIRSQGFADSARLGLPSLCWVAKTSQEARKQWRPRIENYINYAKNIRKGFGRSIDFETIIKGPAICGSPAEVVDRLSEINELLELDTHILLMDTGGMPFSELRDALELMATDVLPHFNKNLNP